MAPEPPATARSATSAGSSASEAWLRTGEGEMFVQDTQSEQVAAFLADLTKDDSDTFKKRFVEMLAGLSPADWELLERMAEKLTQKKEESP